MDVSQSADYLDIFAFVILSDPDFSIRGFSKDASTAVIFITPTEMSILKFHGTVCVECLCAFRSLLKRPLPNYI